MRTGEGGRRGMAENVVSICLVLGIGLFSLRFA